MNKKKIMITVTAISCLTLLATGCGKTAKLKNGEEKAVSLKSSSISANSYYDEIKENNISKLISMVDHKIFDKKYKTTDEETKQIDEQIKQIRTYYKTDDEFNSAIKQYFGVNTEKELRDEMELDFKKKKAITAYIKSNLTDKEINDYYESNITGDIKASHILIKFDVKDDATDKEKEKAEKKALKKAKEIIEKLNKGEKFATLAKKNSDDTATAANGGDLGYFKVDEMDSDFVTAVKGLKDNEYTKEPVKTKSGYHIILRVNEKDKPKLKDVKSEIKTTLTENKLNEDQTEYYKALVKIREKNGLKFNDSKLKKAYDDAMKKLTTPAETSSTDSAESTNEATESSTSTTSLK